MDDHGLRFQGPSFQEGSRAQFELKRDAAGSMFNLVFGPLYSRWVTTRVVTDLGLAEEGMAGRHGAIVDGPLYCYAGSALPDVGPHWQESEGGVLLLFQADPRFASWREYDEFVRRLFVTKLWPSHLRCVLDNFDGAYWQMFSSEVVDYKCLLDAHRGTYLDTYEVPLLGDEASAVKQIQPSVPADGPVAASLRRAHD
jgi:hypothetical protein